MSTLWPCVTMSGLLKELYADDPRAGTFTPSWRFMGKWAKKWSVATRRTSNSKNQRIEERLPKIQRFHKSLRSFTPEPGTGVSSVERGRCGKGQWRSIARCRRVWGSGVGGGSGGASLGVGEAGGARSGGASREGHAHADKKYGQFPLELGANVDQVRTSSSFWEGLS